jgi:hypothetical protein
MSRRRSNWTLSSGSQHNEQKCACPKRRSDQISPEEGVIKSHLCNQNYHVLAKNKTPEERVIKSLLNIEGVIKSRLCDQKYHALAKQQLLKKA